MDLISDNFFVNAPFAMFTFSVNDFSIESANKKAREMWAITQAEIEETYVFDIIPQLAKSDFLKNIKGVLSGAATYKFNEIILNKTLNDVQVVNYIDLNFEAILENDGSFHKIIVWGQDVTDQVLARQKIEEAEIRSRLAIDSGNMGVFDWDFGNTIFLSSPRLLEIFGFAEKWDTSHQDLINTFHPEDKPNRDAAVENSFKNGALVYEARILWPNAGIRWIRVYGKVTYNESMVAKKMYGLVTDISAEKESNQKLQVTSEILAATNEELAATIEELSATNEELAESNKQLSRSNADLDNFIYTASHDLKAPVSNLEGLFHTLLSELEITQEIEEIKHMIDASFERFKKTVYELTEITKLQNQEDTDNEVVSLKEMLKDSLSSIQDFIQQSRAEISIDLEITHLKFSKKNLRSILYNMVSNAVKYRHPDRQPIIKISSYLLQSELVLKFSDNGLGLSQGNISKIFGLFKRVHDHVEGTGIGLFIVKKIVDNVGGKIEVRSELGKGTDFIIYLKDTVIEGL